MAAQIRSADLLDSDGILAVVAAAFAGTRGNGAYEVEAVRGTWARGRKDALELVALDEDGAVIGHVLAAPGEVAGQALPAVAPLSVLPEHQRRGVGTALMSELVTRARGRGWPVLLLLGDPAYYRRFGFAPAARHGLSYAAAGPASPAFQILELGSDWPPVGGEFRFAWEL